MSAYTQTSSPDFSFAVRTKKPRSNLFTGYLIFLTVLPLYSGIAMGLFLSIAMLTKLVLSPVGYTLFPCTAKQGISKILANFSAKSKQPVVTAKRDNGPLTGFAVHTAGTFNSLFSV